KWANIQSIVRTSSLSILALQETHITEQDRLVIESHFRKLKLFVNPDRDSSSNRNGVAFVVNIDKVRWDEASHTVIEPGRASLLELPWHNGNTINILNVYAPSGDDRLNEAFWKTLASRWHGRNRPPKVHILLGDFNVTEATNDRLPLKRPPKGPVEALDAFKTRHSLLDGWRQLHGADGSNYTFSCRNRDGSRSWSRIDRIYCEKPLLDQSCEWQTTYVGALTDHYLVSAVFEPENTPFVGKGRSTAPAFITDFPDAQKLLVKRTIQLDEEI
ncbi:Endonuclease/exonuclease/phosphatase, partial [Ephemerocybe angulata]